MYLLFCYGLPEGNISRESNEVSSLDPDFTLVSEGVFKEARRGGGEDIVLGCVRREGVDVPVCLTGG